MYEFSGQTHDSSDDDPADNVVRVPVQVTQAVAPSVLDQSPKLQLVH